MGSDAVEFVRQNLGKIKKEYDIDFTIINGENAASHGITQEIAETLVNSGADVITMGNHTFDKEKEAKEVLSSGLPVIRPINYPPATCGDGYIIVDIGGSEAEKARGGAKTHNCGGQRTYGGEACGEVSILVINAMGRVNMGDTMDCPFRTVDALLKRKKNAAQVIILDFHAEATSEKIAMRYYLDGQVTAIIGTHTHVPTADECVTESGTAYITDVGMTGPKHSVIGAAVEPILVRFIDKMHSKFEVGDGGTRLCGVVIDVDEYSGTANGIERIMKGN
jgi:calcineurin-like phosphoesterase